MADLGQTLEKDVLGWSPLLKQRSLCELGVQEPRHVWFVEAIFIHLLQYARHRVMGNVLASRREVCQVCLLTSPSWDGLVA